jgi:hypothetical protein
MSLQKIQNNPDILIGSIVIGIVAASRKNREFSSWEGPIQGHPLFHAENGAAVRIKYQSRTTHRRQYGSQIEKTSSVRSSEPAELLKKRFGVFPVPPDEFRFQFRFKLTERLGKMMGIFLV